MEKIPITNKARGEAVSTENTLLTSVASMSQDFKPIKNICAHLNAFHAYASEPSRSVEANHYCGHVNDDVRQCLLYDSAEANARLLGVEYMVTPRIYDSLPPEERRLWHSHVYEVKSGMLIMPNPSVPDSAWELGEKKEMEQIITLYGKVYHLWQTDKGHKVPLGEPQLMTSYTADGQLDFAKVEERDARFGTDYQRKQEARRDIPLPEIHPDASWKIA
ncbi:hypothetical protein HRG_008371 [Hirsutella rhossiliensis]